MVCSLVAVAAQVGLAATVQWAQNGHSYEVVVVPGGITWADAQAAAVAKGGHLATVTSADENLFVFGLMVSTPGAWVFDAEWTQGAWLGGYQDRFAPDYREPLGGWRWVAGEPWGYTNWLQQPYSQPDNDMWNGYGEDYLCFFGFSPPDRSPRPTITPTWNDASDPRPGSTSYRLFAPSYIVEYELIVTASPSVLWPPNHNMVPVTVTVVASDNTGVASRRIISVTSSEPDNGLGDGDTPGDIQITGDLSVLLRAERSGKGNARIYTITVECEDKAGNASTSTTTVTVPRDQGKK